MPATAACRPTPSSSSLAPKFGATRQPMKTATTNSPLGPVLLHPRQLRLVPPGGNLGRRLVDLHGRHAAATLALGVAVLLSRHGCDFE